MSDQDKKPIFLFPRTCELCSQEMDSLTGNFTKYLKIINKFDLFLSFCRWKVLRISTNLNFWCIFSCMYKAANNYKIPQEIWLKLSRFTGRQKKKTLTVIIVPCRRGSKSQRSGYLIMLIVLILDFTIWFSIS